MSIHLEANVGDIAKTILMPGDPLRARFIAEQYLEQARLVSQTRNALYYTGSYKGKPVTVGASGMGCPSIGIYSYELYTEYGAENIIRIGTCGAYSTDLKLFDLINVDKACSESSFARYAWGIEGSAIVHQGRAYEIINETAAGMGKTIHDCNIHSSDIFYRRTWDTPQVALDHQCVAVEMEAFALFANAQHLGKTAATLLTVSDVIPTHEKISADQREKALRPMVELALEAAIKL